MNADKRRRARVQGGWAPPSVSNVRSDRDKPKMPAGPAWLGKNIDQGSQSSEKKFVFEETDEIRQKPPDQVITKAGVYDISSGPAGVSRLRYFPCFIDPTEAKGMFDQLFEECPWRQRSDSYNGEQYLQPRLTAWFGDLPYSYSGVTLDVNKDWPAVMRLLKQHLEEVTGLNFNSVLANLYRDGHDSVAWHADDEKSLKENPTIASLSFGDVRNFELRKKPASGEDPALSQLIRVPLPPGSLLIMEGATQADWHHRVPREYHDRGPRINLTFRVIHPE
ncbi:alpha-ketoglutarate-dependent dioxygenase alkB homolog 3-like [Haliotis rufescens]|uniref:alpha-ketoglutarate-dependent dioxygenase alkB homolog 3-like n=1 Tax=Haliotis rufescens TaxID=6454 RepID=UPI00201F9D8A|nr:alpha-ketoglutarate-dependent dioxygenase alkB homolog 3-like [Haliotis rufescens]